MLGKRQEGCGGGGEEEQWKIEGKTGPEKRSKREECVSVAHEPRSMQLLSALLS